MVQKKSFKNKLENLRVIITTHVYTTGPGFRLEDYLTSKKVGDLIFIGHPFYFCKDRRSFIRIYRKGVLLLEKKFINVNGPEILFWFKDIILTLWWVISHARGKFDYFFGLDNLLVNIGYFLKIFGRIDSLVFYTIDYVPQRFDNNFLNNIYHFSEKFAVRVSDRIWNLSSRMIKAREDNGVSPIYRKKQITVPIGTDLSKKFLAFNKIDKNKIVYLGAIIKKQGVEMLVKVMADVVRKIPTAHLFFIGGGPHVDVIYRDIKRLKLENNISLTGFIEKFSDVQHLLKDAAIAVAPYVDDKKTYTRYTDPGKPKDYLSQGIPVIITRVPEIADEIQKNKCGFAVRYDRKELADAIINLLSNTNKLKEYRKNAYKMAKKYEWSKVFSRAFLETF